MDHDSTCALLEIEVTRVSDAVGRLDPSAPVPTCPGWSVAKLAKHLGSVQRWATTIVATGSTENVDRRSLDLQLPTGDAAWRIWLADSGHRMVETFRSADPEAAAWVWGADPHVRFWPRRMLHEAAIHGVDVEIAAGRSPRLDTVVALDNIDELLTNLPAAATFAPQVSELRGEGSIHLHATDPDVGDAGEWLIRLTADGFDWSREHGKGTVACRGAASDLALLANRRVSLDDRFEVFGRTDLLRFWLDHSAI